VVVVDDYPPNYIPLSKWGEIKLYWSLYRNQIRNKRITIYFPQVELDAIKEEAMRGLEGG